jgi:uncharacterized protein DUF4038/collagenase-like protein with putative collagen-binding domain
VDQDQKPFRIQGDSAQSLIVNLTYEEASAYLSDRQRRGFNTVNINLLEHKFGVNAPANRNGDLPFTRPNDFSTPNESYFAFADSMIDLAASKGMLVSLAAMYLGYDGEDEGWWKVLTNDTNNESVCYEFGRYIGHRYRNRKNILWVIGGDYSPPAGSKGEQRLLKFMQGVKAGGATQLWAGDWTKPSLSTDEPAFASSMDVNAVYTTGVTEHLGATYEEARMAFAHSPAVPAYLKETGYENEGWVPGDAASVRKYQYWAILGGCTAGAFFGNRDIWEFATSSWFSGFTFGHGRWQDALNSAGSRDMTHLGELFDSLAWYELVPITVASKSPILRGGGTYLNNDYVTAAITSDGKTMVAYIPPEGSESITIDLKSLSGPARARWFDPTSGKFADVKVKAFPNAGPVAFSTPGKNSSGVKDWVLVLQPT